MSYPGRWGSPNKHIYFISTYVGRQLGPGSRRSRGWGQVDRQRWREEGTCPWLPLRWGHPEHRQDGGIPALAAREGRRGPFRHPVALEETVSKTSLSNACSLMPRAVARQPPADSGPGDWVKAGRQCQGQSGLCLGSRQEEPCPHCPGCPCPRAGDGGPSLSAPQPFSAVSRASPTGQPANFCPPTPSGPGLGNIRALEPGAKGRRLSSWK